MPGTAQNVCDLLLMLLEEYSSWVLSVCVDSPGCVEPSLNVLGDIPDVVLLHVKVHLPTSKAFRPKAGARRG